MHLRATMPILLGALALPILLLSPSTQQGAPAETLIHLSAADAQALDPDFVRQVQEVLSAYPGVTPREAEERVATQIDRQRVLGEIAEIHHATFAGSWYDLGTGTQHILMTDADELESTTERFEELGIQTKGQLVDQSLEELLD